MGESLKPPKVSRDVMKEWLERREFWKFEKPSMAMQFLYDAEEFYRFRGAEALGYLCKGETARNFILRLFWHLSDESGAYCVGAPLGIAEIGRANPDVFEGFRNKFVSLVDDWEVERKYVVYGMGRVSYLIEDAYPNPKKKVEEVLKEDERVEVVAYAILTAKKLGLPDDVCVEAAERFFGERVKIYDGEKIVEVSFPDVLNMSYSF